MIPASLVLIGVLSLTSWFGFGEDEKLVFVRELYNLYTEDFPSCSEANIHVFEDDNAQKAWFYAQCIEWKI
jgi:hypothetical protein